ncbi:Uncharacterised protein [Citrobacter freundii]|nr:Uncharacterised protein [Citrobacter freundii]
MWAVSGVMILLILMAMLAGFVSLMFNLLQDTGGGQNDPL